MRSSGIAISTLNSNCRRGFTTVQLLIVIFIVFLVSAFIYAELVTQREYARFGLCSSNERQLGIAFTEYTADNDRTLPPGHTDVDGAGWAGQLFPYVKNAESFRCPDDNSRPRIRVVRATGASYRCYPVSYAYNRNLEAIGTIGTYGAVKSMPQPGATVLLTEVSACNQSDFPGQYNIADLQTRGELGGGMDRNGIVSYSSVSDGIHAWNGSARTLLETGIGVRAWDPKTFAARTGRHNGGSLYLLVDGHVHWAKAECVSTGPIYNFHSNPACVEKRTSPQDDNLAVCGETSAGTAAVKNWNFTFSPI